MMGHPRRARVLVIDDNPSVRLSHRALLNRLGCDVSEAAGGQEAIDLIKKPFDLIFTDLHMPHMNGIEFTQHAREFDKGIKIVTISADFNEQERKACLNAGALEVIHKPAALEELERLLDSYA
jgi:CheY-like chemotaxis protein